MIDVYIETSDGDTFLSKVNVLPRIGETVKLPDASFWVLDVVHTMPDRYTNYSILLVLEKK